MRFANKKAVKKMRVNGKTLSMAVIAVFVFGALPLTTVAGASGQWPLGLEIAGKFDELLSAHQTDIQCFITDHKVLMSETKEERLVIIEGKISELKAKIAAVNETRQQLIADLQDGLNEEDFVAGMRELATDLVNTAQFMGELGELLGAVGQDNADALSSDLSDLGDEVAAIGSAIADEMRDRGLPIPEDLPTPEDVPRGP